MTPPIYLSKGTYFSHLPIGGDWEFSLFRRLLIYLSRRRWPMIPPLIYLGGDGHLFFPLTYKRRLAIIVGDWQFTLFRRLLIYLFRRRLSKYPSRGRWPKYSSRRRYPPISPPTYLGGDELSTFPSGRLLGYLSGRRWPKHSSRRRWLLLPVYAGGDSHPFTVSTPPPQ